MNSYLVTYEQIDRLSERIAENPRYGYLIAGGILLLCMPLLRHGVSNLRL